MRAMTLFYRWLNDPHRRERLYGRPCRVVTRGGMNSVLVEFTDGLEPRRTLCSRYAVSEIAPRPLQLELLPT